MRTKERHEMTDGMVKLIELVGTRLAENNIRIKDVAEYDNNYIHISFYYSDWVYASTSIPYSAIESVRTNTLFLDTTLVDVVEDYILKVIGQRREIKNIYNVFFDMKEFKDAFQEWVDSYFVIHDLIRISKHIYKIVFAPKMFPKNDVILKLEFTSHDMHDLETRDRVYNEMISTTLDILKEGKWT